MHPVRIRALEAQGTSTLQTGGPFTTNSGELSFTTSVQQLVMQNAKCRQFKSVREHWDPWSLEWPEVAQMMQGVAGVENTMALGNLLKMYMDKATRTRWVAKGPSGGL